MKRETRDQAIARADRESARSLRLERVIRDLIYADPADAERLVTFEGGEGILFKLYRAQGAEGGILVSIQTRARAVDVHNFEEFKRLADERAARLGGAEYHAISDACAYLWRKRAEIFERLAGVAP